MPRPLIGITTDLGPHPTAGRPICRVALAYAQCVTNAGGVPVLLPPILDLVEQHLSACDAFVFTGGDDPRTESFGQPTHSKATPMDPTRQAYEMALFRALETQRPEAPVLGICLGMQLLSLVSGGTLNQHLPDTLPTHADHYAREHEVVPTSHPVSSNHRGVRQELRGLVASHHRQAVSDPGRLEILARSHDGVIEAVSDPSRAFCLGVQWHPERTGASDLGQGLFDHLVAVAST
jgi:gamma-glutamyl-gamma-aminobutyrate hydrolase PuuD